VARRLPSIAKTERKNPEELMAEPQTPSLPLYDTINNRTFHGLLIAEFLAAFNDQCIHASAMFFALRKGTLTESQAVSLMPLLFYSPWVLFAPLAGYLADRISKRTSLIFWKVAEVGITSLALLGFWLGATFEGPLGAAGPWVVMSCVFLMGTHSAFYVPNKYGVLPETFTVRMLSRANGYIESTTFLAVILGTTVGGFLSHFFKPHEYYIGFVLVVLALVGTLTSLFIRRMPPADPTRPFREIFTRLFGNVRVLATSRLSSVAVLGLAFFTFMVAYMRSTMYMYGESQIPHLTEWETSLLVAVVSLGVGIGSPLAGLISGGKIELGLVPLGGLGIVFALSLAGLLLFLQPVLVVCLVLIGLSSSLYLVPLYSLLQYSAPKGSKGMSVATNNFICSAGASIASVAIYLLVHLAFWVGAAYEVPTVELYAGTLVELKGEHGDWQGFNVETPAGLRTEQNSLRELGTSKTVVYAADHLKPGEQVAVNTWALKGAQFYYVRPVGEPMRRIDNQERVPRYLFLGAAGLMFFILLLLCLRLPEFPLRTVVFLRALRRRPVRITGYDNLPVKLSILVTNGRSLAECRPFIAGVVRPMRLILPAPGAQADLDLPARAASVQYLALNGEGELPGLIERTRAAMRRGFWPALSTGLAAEQLRQLLAGLEQDGPLAIVPVYSEAEPPPGTDRPFVHIGAPLPATANPEDIRKAFTAGEER
jgi:MFS family permease